MTSNMRYDMRENMPMSMVRSSDSKHFSCFKKASIAPSPAPRRRICEARLGRK